MRDAGCGVGLGIEAPRMVVVRKRRVMTGFIMMGV
jgi:hypothetical protein